MFSSAGHPSNHRVVKSYYYDNSNHTMDSAHMKTFGVDSRTHPGRQLIVEMMVRHQKRLQDIAAGKGRYTKIEIYKGFNTTKTLDTAPPRSYHQEDYVTKKRSIQEQQELMLHRQRHEKLLKRIAAYPTATERRANRFDPVAHPVFLKRTIKQKQTIAASKHKTPTSKRDAALKARIERDVIYSTGATRSERYYVADPFSNKLKPRELYDAAKLTTQQGLTQIPRPSTSRSSGIPLGVLTPRNYKSKQKKNHYRPATAPERGRWKPTTARWSKEASEQNSAQIGEEKTKGEEYDDDNNTTGIFHLTAVKNDRVLSRPSTAAPPTSNKQPQSRQTRSAFDNYNDHEYDEYDQDEKEQPLEFGVEYTAPADHTDSIDHHQDADNMNPNDISLSPYDCLYHMLISLVDRYKFQHLSSLEILFDKAKLANQHLDDYAVQQVLQRVKEEWEEEQRQKQRQRQVETKTNNNDLDHKNGDHPYTREEDETSDDDASQYNDDYENDEVHADQPDPASFNRLHDDGKDADGNHID